MIELEVAIKNRRAIRKYNNELISEDEIKKIIEAGTYAPSACNIQGWHFIILNKDDLTKMIHKGGGATFLKNINQAILVIYDRTSDNTEYMDYIQSGVACIENMLLMACDMGIGTCWVNNLPRKSQMRKLLNIPWYFDPIGLVTLGRYNQKINERKRKYNVDDLISYSKYTGKDIHKPNRNFILMHIRRTMRKIYYIMPFKPLIIKLFGKLEKKFDN